MNSKASLRFPSGLCVLGNGPLCEGGVCPPGIARAVFNRIDNSADICIYNGRFLSRIDPFIARSTDNDLCSTLGGALKREHDGLRSALGSRASSGLTFVSLACRLTPRLWVYRMPLAPSLARPVGLGNRKPLACAYHNWLGERRLAFEILHTASHDCRIHWSSLCIPDPEPSSIRRGDPWETLQAAASNRSTELWEQASRHDAFHWADHLDKSRLQQVEPLFHLLTDESDTSNWWLYDQAASVAVERLVKKLMWCQQQCYLNLFSAMGDGPAAG